MHEPAEYSRRWRARHKASGICLFCTNLATPYTVCTTCRKTNGARSAKLRAERRSKGLCARCGELAWPRSLCDYHLAQAREANRRYKHAREVREF